LGDATILKQYLDDATDRLDSQSNVLESFATSKLKYTPCNREAGTEYQRITNSVLKKFESDFEYILGARNRPRDYLIPLVEFYYFTYTAQAILQLNRFLDGDRSTCVPLFFRLEWEKTSQNRQCYSQGWNILQIAAKKIFAHAVTLEILNQTTEQCKPVDYIKLQELINSAPGEDHRIAAEIKRLTDRYRAAISDCTEMKELQRRESPDGETAAEVRFLFESVRLQFENTVRNRPYSSYAKNFEDYSKKYLQQRGRSGMMLTLTEEILIFLTKICIKDQEKMRLNDVFAEFEARGIFLDNHSKAEMMRYYEKLNLIEKKSDSGDAQYVKRIL
jgi:DNA phosphorothioation-dependent restriction protein DptG